MCGLDPGHLSVPLGHIPPDRRPIVQSKTFAWVEIRQVAESSPGSAHFSCSAVINVPVEHQAHLQEQ